jgi:hypothetical protein
MVLETNWFFHPHPRTNMTGLETLSPRRIVAIYASSDTATWQ